ncbi:MAG: LamG-like jellyroll fold domain-containing protein [Chitinophagaceae bacterium]
MTLKKLLIVLFLFTVKTICCQVNLSKGLLAYYPFNGNTNDVSGNNLNAVNFGATPTTNAANKINSAYDFNGTSANILLPNSPKFNFNATDSFSISCWIQPSNNAALNLQALIVKAVFDANVQNANWSYGLYLNLDKAMSGFNANDFLNGTTSLSQNNCWYHLVVTYKNGIWILYVNGKVEAQDLTQTKFISQNASVSSTIAIGKKGSSNGEYYKGKIDEVRIYSRNINKGEVETLYQLENTTANFSISQNACNPKQISFKTNTININKAYWNFGDGFVDSNKVQFNYTYSNFNNYNVQLVIQNNFGCFDTTVKNISVLVNFDSSILSNNKDTSICSGKSLSLISSNSFTDFCWLSSDNSLTGSVVNPMVTPINTTTYTLTTKALGNNLILNGDFEQGNSGFETDYVFNPGTAGAIQGIYTIGNNPKNWLSAFAACTDHTPGTTNDKMLMLDGSTKSGVELWRQTIFVKPNTTYNFSFWLQSIVAQNPAVIKVKINGKYYENSIKADLATCSWKNFNADWHSGTSSTVTITLEDSMIVSQGNDFAIDDISLNEITLKQDSMRVFVSNPTIQTINQTICFGQSLNGYSTSGNYQDKFLNIFGCDSTVNLNLTVLNAPTVQKKTVSGCDSVILNSVIYTTNQFVKDTIKNQLGCDSIILEYDIKVLSKPVNFINPKNITVCLGKNFSVNGFANYLWNTGDTSANINLNGLNKYWVSVTNADGCKGSDTINVNYNSATYDSVNKTICFGDSINGYKVTGIYRDTLINYLGCDSFKILNLTVLTSPKTTLDTLKGCGSVSFNGFTYTSNQMVTIKTPNQLGCDSIIAQHQIIVLSAANNVLFKNDTSICEGIKLTLYPGSFKSYLWSTGALDTAIIIDKKGLYWVTVTNAANCSVTDTFNLIDVYPTPKNFIIPNKKTTCLGKSFTLNGFNNYQWNTGENTSSINLNGLDKYWVAVTNTNGCQGTDTLYVKYSNATIDSTSKTICFGDSVNGYKTTGIYRDTLANYLGCDSIKILNLTVLPALVFTSDTITSCESVIFNGVTYYNSQLVSTIIKNQLGCDSINSQRLIEILTKPLNFISPKRITTCLGEKFSISGFNSFKWNTGDVGPFINLNGLNKYWVEVVGNNGCVGSDTLTVEYSGKFEPSGTNAFSPNGDGINDEFKPYANSGCFKKYRIVIFNRNGQKLFESTNPLKAWDGNFNRKPLPVGVYYYIINFETTSGLSDVKSGYLSLLR